MATYNGCNLYVTLEGVEFHNDCESSLTTRVMLRLRRPTLELCFYRINVCFGSARPCSTQQVPDVTLLTLIRE